jgi:hypothetical protein
MGAMGPNSSNVRSDNTKEVGQHVPAVVIASSNTQTFLETQLDHPDMVYSKVSLAVARVRFLLLPHHSAHLLS